MVYIPLGQAIGRWGNFFNQEAYGRNTTLPWGMKSDVISQELANLKAAPSSSIDPSWNIDPNMPVHPAFLYEFLWNIALFFFLVRLRSKAKFEGEVFAMYMALYGLGRFFVEGLRTDSLMTGSFRISQILGIVFFVAFVSFIVKKRRMIAKTPNSLDVEKD
jgi:phosphatidylglycerol---prolipoprotein diacylglyceryl transferase